jgi:hypothetical protein
MKMKKRHEKQKQKKDKEKVSKIMIFWDVMPYILVDRFGETYCFPFLGRRIK